MIHRKPTVLVISCSLALVTAVVLAGLYSRHLRDANLARACDGFDYRFVYESHHIGMNLRNGETISPVIHPAELRGCVRIDSVTAGADGSASVRGQIRLQSVTYGERRFSPDTPPWRPLLGFEATYGYPRKGKMAWKFWEPDGTRVSSSMNMLLVNLCAPFAEAASPGVFRDRFETIETESGEQHVFYKLGEDPWANVVGWYVKPGDEMPVRIYADYYRESRHLRRPTRSKRLNAVAIDPLAPAAAEPTFDAPTSE